MLFIQLEKTLLSFQMSKISLKNEDSYLEDYFTAQY